MPSRRYPQYAIPVAIVDGRSLADLAHGCMDSGLAPQMQDLLVCVQNIQEVASLLRQPGRRFMGEGGRCVLRCMTRANLCTCSLKSHPSS